MSSRSLVITIACFALVALALRVVRLDERPPHTDEAVNAWLLGQVLAGQPFAFDVRDRHGPLLPAAGLVVATILGRRSFAELDERTIRLAPAIIGAAATGLFLLGQGMLPSGVLVTTAGLWAMAPLPLYYARYAIHETLLVSATLAFLLMLARSIHTSMPRARVGWAAGAGLAAGLMLAAKASALIPFAAAAAAVLVVGCPLAGARSTDALRTGVRERTAHGWRRIVAIALPVAFVAAFTVACAYTWGFTRAAGLHELIFGLDAPLARAAGQGHEKSVFYFLSILGYGAAGIVLLIAAVAGGVTAWREGGPLARGLVVYAVIMLGVHSAIPYKTPWLALGLWLPLAAIAAFAVDALVRWAWRQSAVARLVALLTLGAGTAATAATSRSLVYAMPADENNPLAYTHTSPDLLRVGALIASLPGSDPLIAVYLEDPWPLPFLLRAQSRVGYWQPGQAIAEGADLLITTPELAASLGPEVATWRPHYFSQRPGVMLVALQPPAPAAAAP